MTAPTGIHCVLYAFFDRAGALDRGAMRAQVETVLAIGVNGIAVLGLATEVNKLSPDEARDIVSWAADDIGGRCPLAVTVAGDSASAQRDSLRQAVDLGATSVILQPPRTAPPDLADHFAEVARDARVPVGIQNAPQFLGQSLSPDRIAQLAARLPELAFIKAEGSVLDLAETVARTAPRLVSLGGRGGLEMTDCLRVGAGGFVLAPDAVDHACRVHDLWTGGAEDAAEDAHAAVLPALVFMMNSIDHLICYGKRIFAARAGLTVHDRQPAMAPTPAGLRLALRWADRLGPVRARTAS